MRIVLEIIMRSVMVTLMILRLLVGGGCRVPQSWKLLYKSGNDWKPVETTGNYAVAKDKFNKVTFAPVTITALRLEVQLQPKFSGGILEWRMKE